MCAPVYSVIVCLRMCVLCCFCVCAMCVCAGAERIWNMGSKVHNNLELSRMFWNKPVNKIFGEPEYFPAPGLCLCACVCVRACVCMCGFWYSNHLVWNNTPFRWRCAPAAEALLRDTLAGLARGIRSCRHRQAFLAGGAFGAPESVVAAEKKQFSRDAGIGLSLLLHAISDRNENPHLVSCC